jgi:DNA polymerase-4
MRTIVYVDPPAFCTTVERLVAPGLRSRPLVVAPPGAERAVVLALSPEAELAGIRRGMPVRLARRMCPDLVVVPPNPALYARASRALHDLLARWAPVIEPRWYGHAFLDLTGTERLFGPALDVAARIRREAAERLRLPLSVGVATNKLVSEAATRAGHAEHLVDIWPVARGEEASFLAPRPVAILPEIPDAIRRRLDDYQLDRIGQIAAIPEAELYAVFGPPGRTLATHARGIDPRPVLPPTVRTEFRLEHTLATDTNDLGVLHALLRHLAEQLGRRLRARGLATRRVTLALDYADCIGARRAIRVPDATLDVELWDAARRALALARTRRVAIRRVTLTADRLVEANLQLELWDHPPPPRAAALQRALDEIRRRTDGRLPIPPTTPARSSQIPDRPPSPGAPRPPLPCRTWRPTPAGAHALKRRGRTTEAPGSRTPAPAQPAPRARGCA